VTHAPAPSLALFAVQKTNCLRSIVDSAMLPELPAASLSDLQM
jgi:hypothetical protein